MNLSLIALTLLSLAILAGVGSRVLVKRDR